MSFVELIQTPSGFTGFNVHVIYSMHNLVKISSESPVLTYVKIKISVMSTKTIYVLFLRWDKSSGEKEISEVISVYDPIFSCHSIGDVQLFQMYVPLLQDLKS